MKPAPQTTESSRRGLKHQRSTLLLLALVLLAIPHQFEAAPEVIRPFEDSAEFVPANTIDTLLLGALRKRGIQPANRCSDEVFVRRVFLDAIGTLPEPEEVQRFLEDRQPAKRSRLIDSLLKRDEFNDYWALKWCDVLRVKAEFPINLWPNAVQAYHRWVRDAIRKNMPYDRFARELLTSSGSNFRVPPVNFYRAIQGQEPRALAQAVAQTFMGVRLENWEEDRRVDLETFFSRVAFKRTAEWKEEIVYLSTAPSGILKADFPDGSTVRIGPNEDPREAFAKWLISPNNPWFARCAANRIWAWLFGRGLIHEPDDIRPGNPATIPEILTYLEKELVKSGYDLRHVCRLVLNSRTYQQSSIPQTDQPDAESLFARYPVRRLDAEVLIDSLCRLFGSNESYSSDIPEPFTFIPEHQRAISLADGSITSPFLEMFGRPPRDTGLWSERNNETTETQRLHLLNSTHIQNKIRNSERLRRLLRRPRKHRGEIIQTLYLSILSRYPTETELRAVHDYVQTSGLKPVQAAYDLTWALINTKEFLYRH